MEWKVYANYFNKYLDIYKYLNIYKLFIIICINLYGENGWWLSDILNHVTSQLLTYVCIYRSVRIGHFYCNIIPTDDVIADFMGHILWGTGGIQITLIPKGLEVQCNLIHFHTLQYFNASLHFKFAIASRNSSPLTTC